MSQYKVLIGINYPSKKGAEARIIKGEDVPYEERGMTRAEPGDIVDDIPATSIKWLTEAGAIEAVD